MKLSYRFIAAASVCLLASASAFATTVTVNNPDPNVGHLSSYVASPQPARQTHIIGIYTGGVHANNGVEVATVKVHVNGKAPSKPVTLVLSAYERTNWVIDGKTRAAIGTVIINGYHPSTVSGLSFLTKVVNRTGVGNYLSAAAIEWPNDTGGGDTPALVKGVQAYTHTPISSFTGYYEATDFSVNLTK